MTAASQTGPAPAGGFLERRFRLAERRSTLRSELLGGVATFLTMSYILFVNPAILSAADMPFTAVAVATAIASCLATLAMGLFTNLPFALAPGLGINAVVAFDIVLGRGLEWPVAMAIIVIEGLIALVLVLAGLREAIMRAVPLPLKLSIGVGIGLFITLVGLREGGIVVNNPATGIGLGDLTQGPPLIALAGILVAAVLVDSGAAAVGGAMGVSSVTTYVESGAGVAEGARTGLAPLVTAGLFLLTILFVPIVALVAQDVPFGEDTFIHPAIAPALVMVGYLMMRIVRDIDWDLPESAIPAFLTIAGIPLTFSIAAGIGFGVIGYVVVMLAVGKARQIHPLMWAIAPFFVLFFAADWLEVNVF